MKTELQELKESLDKIVSSGENLDRKNRVEFMRYLGEKYDTFHEKDFEIGDIIRDEGGDLGVCIAPDTFLFFGDCYVDGMGVFDIRDLGETAFTGERIPEVSEMLMKIKERVTATK